jgi:capsular exopolysaccharide synthesis family protein
MSNYYNPVSFDFSYYSRVLKSSFLSSYKKVFSVSGVLGLLVYLYTFTIPPQYEAIAVMHVAPQDNAVFDLRALLMQRRDPAYQETQVGIILSRTLIRKVVIENKLDSNPLFISSEKSLFTEIKQSVTGLWSNDPVQSIKPVRIATESLRESVVVEPKNKSYLIDIKVTLPSPEVAADVANSLASAYIESTYQSQRDSAGLSESWLIERLQAVRGELRTAEELLQLFKEEQNIIGSSQQNSGIANQEHDVISVQLIEAREKRLALDALYQQIRTTEQSGGDLQGIAAVQNDQLIQNIRAEVLQLEQRKSELSRRYGPEHRRMIELVSQIQAANRSLNSQIIHTVSAIKADYELAKNNEKYLEQSLGESVGKVQSLGRNRFKLLDLEQNVSTQREIYAAFLERLNQSKATGDNINNNVRITDPALPPLQPVKSKGNIFVLITFILASIFGFSLAVLKEFFENTVVSRNDAELKLGCIAMGLVPKIEDVVATDEAPNIAYHYFRDNKNSGYAEAIRNLRSSLLLSSLNKPKQRILFTSTEPSEGKTSLAISVAIAFGAVRKTLLIDADLRRPSIHELLNGNVSKRYLGLSDLCIETASNEECIHSIEGYDIDILPAGTITPNPQELFCSTRFSALLNELSEIYDLIVIDSPPAGGLSDAHMIASQTDQLIYVVKAGETAVPKIRASIQALKDNNVVVNGVVINQVSQEDSSYGYYYGSDQAADS